MSDIERKRLAIAFDSTGHPRLALGEPHPEFARYGGQRVEVVPASQLEGAVEALADELHLAGPSAHDCDYDFLQGWEAAVEWLRVRAATGGR